MDETLRPIKILRIITRLNVGGPSKQIASLFAELDSSKYEQILVAGSVEHDEIDDPVKNTEGLEFREIPNLGRSLNFLADIRAFLALVRLIRLERPAIVHTHLSKAGVLGRFAAFVCRVPVRIHTFHGHLLFGYFTGPKKAIYLVIERFLKSVTTFQVTVGEKVRRDLIDQRIVQASKSISVVPGIETPLMMDKSLARRTLSLSADDFVVLFVGRLVQIKRLDRFVEIMRGLHNNQPRAVGVIVGDGPSKDLLNLEDVPDGLLRFEGWQLDTGVYYSAADVICLTSDNEGMPIALIEAALCGLPCVSTNVGSASEVVINHKTGLVFECEDVDGLTNGLLRLSNDPSLRETFGKNAQEYSNQTFNPKRLAEVHDEIYMSLCDSMMSR